MVDIKSEIAVGKPLPLKEKPLAGDEKLKQSLDTLIEGERADNFEQARENVISEIDQMENPAPATVIVPTAGIIAPTAKRQKQVENVLAQGMTEIYLILMPEKSLKFKAECEKTDNKINQLLAKTKIDIGEIIKLIKKWLSLIPGLNKYFLEQEAKIKA
ncbi:MAG: hypothetical protein Q8O59_03715, partial [bacterium]|nr:hypothetical protein [bacterium]